MACTCTWTDPRSVFAHHVAELNRALSRKLERPNMPNSEVEEPRTLVKSKLRSDELDEEEGFLIASCSRAPTFRSVSIEFSDVSNETVEPL